MIAPEGGTSVAPVRPGRSIIRSGFEAHIRRGAEAGWKAAQATQAVAGPALTAVGFTAAGVAKKTLASRWQSGLGSVARGSTFSRLQSLGARGGLPVLVVAGVGLAVGGIACAISYLSESAAKEKDDESSARRDEANLLE
ncbi:hypothetical protein EXIGLDRAFT_774699 [Exidia glandulosa HHB12029]|uniref:Uncharacterized protein n=1 Tax=Exidia glandulosa HHB12029 TaxID=1314781 RepID=A0A165E943_EXIGL|nr:hypothetical protein EXIGLDRAFT_774699 [Exidia glandulosa HHB12029]